MNTAYAYASTYMCKIITAFDTVFYILHYARVTRALHLLLHVINLLRLAQLIRNVRRD